MSAHASISDSLPLIPESTPSITRWFMNEVHPHEAALRAYVRARFPSLPDVDDLVQETFARILRARANGQVRSPKGLLFATARNAALDLVRQNQVVPMTPLSPVEESAVPDQRLSTAEMLSREQELRLLEQAVESLPHRCQQILVYKKLQGLSYAEIGARLGIKPNTVSAQLTIGVLRCRRYLEEHGVIKGWHHE